MEYYRAIKVSKTEKIYGPTWITLYNKMFKENRKVEKYL